VPDLATDLAWDLVAAIAITAAITAATTTTTAASFTVATHRAMTATTPAMKRNINTDLLLLLGFNPSLNDQELRVQIIQRPWLSFGCECLNK
jgi:hypothetical protein